MQSNQSNNLGEQLIYVMSPPRSGSTMLRMMLESHALIAGSAEPHLMASLCYAGYFAKPDKAAYDIVNSSLGLTEFVNQLPRGEAAYLDACRAYAITLYNDAIKTKKTATRFIDKTPPNVLEWPFITAVFPEAKYIALTRHPLAIYHSYAETFFAGDYQSVLQEGNLLATYITSMASFLREAQVSKITVAYENIIHDAQAVSAEILKFLELSAQEDLANYGHANVSVGTLGDPLNAHKLNRPVDVGKDRWVQAIASDPQKLEIVKRVIAEIPEADLATFGYPVDEIFKPLQAVGTQVKYKKKRLWSWYLFKRRVYLLLKKMLGFSAFRKGLENVKYYCEVLLRD